MTKPLKLACIGTGYFAQFHIEAWTRIPQVELVALCDQDLQKVESMAKQFKVDHYYNATIDLYQHHDLDLVDIITPPNTHMELCTEAAAKGIDIICQKPLAPSYQEAEQLVQSVSDKVTLLVHENFRHQPWYQKIKSMINEGVVGRVHSLYMQTRLGDGWQSDAYLNRQPYFRTMERLLIYETGVHFIDTFRFLMGEAEAVYADLKKLNQDIVGEDSGLMVIHFKNGSRAIWDANRYNESQSSNPRYTFGELLLEGDQGTIQLYSDGEIILHKLGEKPEAVVYEHHDRGFGADCVYFTQKYLINCLIEHLPCELSGDQYLENLRIQEAVYQSAQKKQVVNL
jgi:predicted dehydrogenase